MPMRAPRDSRRGAALILTILLSLAITAIALGAIVISSAAWRSTSPR